MGPPKIESTGKSISLLIFSICSRIFQLLLQHFQKSPYSSACSMKWFSFDVFLKVMYIVSTLCRLGTFPGLPQMPAQMPLDGYRVEVHFQISCIISKDGSISIYDLRIKYVETHRKMHGWYGDLYFMIYAHCIEKNNRMQCIDQACISHGHM